MTSRAIPKFDKRDSTSASWVRLVSALLQLTLLFHIAHASESIAQKSTGKRKKKKNDATIFIGKMNKKGGAKRQATSRPSTRNQGSTKKKESKPAALEQGGIVVVTEGGNAEVVIRKDGIAVKRGRSAAGRFNAMLPPGEYEVEVISAGSSMVLQKATIAAGAVANITAIKPTGTIVVRLEFYDPEMKVFVDEEPVASWSMISEDEMIIERVPLGFHSLRFSHRAIRDATQRVELEGSKIYVNQSFEVIAGKVVVLSNPGADVYVDGKREGTVTAEGRADIYVAPGLHTIRVEKAGYIASEITREFTLGQIALNLKLVDRN